MRNSIPSRFQKLFLRLRQFKVPYKLAFIIIGIASTVWFLVRVIPKPSRATYPCMRVAAPFMSSFVIYLLSLGGSFLLLKRSRELLYRRRYLLATGIFIAAVGVFALSTSIFPEKGSAAEQAGFIPSVDSSQFPPNFPMGEELGIFPGRVVWEWDPDATNENCTNAHNFDNPDLEPDGYHLAKNNDQQVIDRMLKDVVCKLSGTYDVHSAWELLFRDFNERKGNGAVSYTPGQKIFIKINGGGSWLADQTDLSFDSSKQWKWKRYPNSETSGPMALALLRQLIDGFGIAQEDIYIGDPNSHIMKDNYDQMAAVYPQVKYADKLHTDLGRTLIHKSTEPAIAWSDKESIMNDEGIEGTRILWEEMEDADYLINLATLKAHARAGVTLTAKNHFGSHTNDDGAWPLHDGLVSHVDNDTPFPIRNEYGVYRVLTDIMGHEKLGANTVLFLMEGLWGGPEAVSSPVKWQSAPFNGDWPSSILAAQDAVALESVCFDILRTEFNTPWDDSKEDDEQAPGLNRPWYGAVDDHLHQAADSENWPEGIIYDPEGDGTPMGSMGVHEHWNNSADKQYSRNLGYNYGIELITPKSLVSNTVNALEAELVPLIDGDPSDDCWQAAQWYHIDQTWIGWGESIDSSDFFGRFKVSWSEAENLLYYLVEITDDSFVDGYVYPDEGAHTFDVVEVFVDEDASGGDHKLNENAFAYHLAVNAPEDGSSESAFFAMDLGADWARMDYANQFSELSMKKSGNKYYYEFALGTYADSYDHNNPEASRVTLTGNKEMGMSIAYCDNDAPDGERDNFFGSVWVPEEENNNHWISADGFGRVRLINAETSLNHAVEVRGEISDYVVRELNTDLELHENLGTLFYDPDSDPLSYSVNCDQAELTFTITDQVLKVNVSASFEGEADVELRASDGEFEASVSFKITSDIVGIQRVRRESELISYPNPFTDLLHVSLNLESAYTGQASVLVLDISGRTLISHNDLHLSGGRGTLSLDMSGEPRGTYMLKIQAGKEIQSILVTKN